MDCDENENRYIIRNKTILIQKQNMEKILTNNINYMEII